MRILKRIGNVIEGLVFILLSLCWQSLSSIVLTMAVLSGLSALELSVECKVWQWTVFTLLIVIFNSVACWEYFMRRRTQMQLGEREWIIFMVPRAIDLIWNGSERITR